MRPTVREMRAKRSDGRGRRGLTAIAAALPGICGRALRRRGFVETGVVTEWPVIVGEALAAETVPHRLVFARGSHSGGTLHVRVSGAFATELQHLAPLVIDRINGYFGFGAVARLALTQGPVPTRRRTGGRRPEPPTDAADPVLAARLEGIDDPGLRDALEGLGRAIGRRRDRRPRA